VDGPAFEKLLPDEDVMGLLLAALGHDVDHPGTNNGFQVATASTLAIRYNDVQVLENHHAAITCGLLQNGTPSMVERAEEGKKRRIRQVVVASILGTDMAKHQESVAYLESSNTDLNGFRNSDATLDSATALKLETAVLHCADLAHPALTWSIHKQMSVLMATEFNQQFNEEQRLGLPSLPFMGKNPQNLRELAPVQGGFFQFVAIPLWKALRFYAGGNFLEEVVDNVEANKGRWQKIADGEDVGDDVVFKHPQGHVPTPRS